MPPDCAQLLPAGDPHAVGCMIELRRDQGHPPARPWGSRFLVSWPCSDREAEGQVRVEAPVRGGSGSAASGRPAMMRWVVPCG